MKNKEIAAILNEIADFLEIQDVDYKPRAYRTAARNIESLSEDIQDIHEKGELEEIDGVGESIAEKIEEYLETGEIEYHQDLKQELPINIDAITSVEGVGPKTAKKLYQALGIRTLEDLEKAAQEGKIAEVEGFGEKSQQNILDHMELAKRGQERMLLGSAYPIAEDIGEKLRDSSYFGKVEIVGSFRRRRPTVGDIDILATSSNPEEAMNEFCGQEDVKEILSKGKTKSSIIASGDLHMDLRIIGEAEFGAGLIYFTGSKDHNITLRNRSIDRDLKLNEYGLFDISDIDDPDKDQRSGELVASETEQDVYGKLDMEWIPPELREDTGEIEAAANNELPNLVETEDISGDLQIHTEYSDGSNNVKEMAEAAGERGLEYILITDHGPGASIPSKITRDEFKKQREEIDDLDLDIEVLHGIEAEITNDGLGISNEWCEECDLVVAGMHGRLSSPTEHILNALEEYSIDIFAHPTNRLINEREPLDLDMDSIIRKASSNDIAVEINAQPKRLDLDWKMVKRYRDQVGYVVSTDAHSTAELDYMHLGVSQARRGWCEDGNILNTGSLSEFKSNI